MTDVGRDLRESEDKLQTFLQRNRDYRNSPQLSFEQERLAREIAMRQQVFTSVVQAFEQARTEEVRDTPVLNIIDAPEVPSMPNGRGVVRLSILAALTGLLVGILLAAWLDPQASGKWFSLRDMKRWMSTTRVSTGG